jgi:phosphoglycerate dehydrogenase-like enzyme
MQRLRGLYILNEDAHRLVYGPSERQAIEQHVEMVGPPQTRSSIAENKGLLNDVEVIFSGWGAPIFDEKFLDAAPKLKVLFYGAGTVAYCTTPAVWERGILVTTAIAANSIPVAEYTLANILLSLKRARRLANQTRQQRRFPARDTAPGCYGTTIGLISLGATARTLLNMLWIFDLRLIAYDPFVDTAEAEQLGLELVTLDELFSRSDVVSLHTPLLPETTGIITGRHLASMKPDATFINTARGAIVRQNELIEVAINRPDLEFVLDVTYPEPPEPDSPLYTLPNVLLSPHIAGSVGCECRRMGRYMVEELLRYVRGEPLRWAVTPQVAARSTPRVVVQLPRKPRSVEIA